MPHYAILVPDHEAAIAVLDDIASWVLEGIFDDARMICRADSATVYRWGAWASLTIDRVTVPYEGDLRYAVGLTPSQPGYELPTAVCWDLLAAIAAYRPLPTWLAASVWPPDILERRFVITPCRIVDDDGSVLSASEYSRLIDPRGSL